MVKHIRIISLGTLIKQNILDALSAFVSYNRRTTLNSHH